MTTTTPEMWICPRCGANVEAAQRFCTECGAEMRFVPTPPPSYPSSETSLTPAPGWPKRAKVALALASVAFASAAAVAIFLALELTSTIDEKKNAEAWLAVTQGELATTKTQLSESEGLSSRRKTVLQQADRIINQVDPLLTSVDGMKSITNQMTATQKSFAGNAGLAVGSLAALLDHVAGTSPLSWDLGYISSLIDDVRSGAAGAGADQDRFEAHEKRYRTVSRTFEERATRYVRSVERLDKQLTVVTE